MADTREMLALVVCNATQKTNYKCEFDCEKKGKCAYCLIMAEQMIANGVTVTDNNVGGKWISVKERFPDLVPCSAGTAYSEAVNVLTTGRKVLTAIWNGSYWICDAEFWEAEFEEITHWTPVLLPIPEPPKGE